MEKKVEEMYNSVKSKAVTDKEFRLLLLNDPNTAIQSVTGHSVPDKMRLRFIEKPADVDALYVLPDFIGNSVSESDLDSIAGGDCLADACAGYVKVSAK